MFQTTNPGFASVFAADAAYADYILCVHQFAPNLSCQKITLLHQLIASLLL